LYNRNILNNQSNSSIKNQENEYETVENERNFSSPRNFEDDSEIKGKLKAQIRRPEPRTNFTQNVHQYGLALENSNENANFETNKKNPLYSTNFKVHGSKNTDV
jgi:hypothetical protein